MLERACFDGAVLEVNGALGEARERERGHKLCGGFGHADAHFGAFLLQQAQEFTRLVGGNSARDSKKDFLSSEIHSH